MRPRSRSAWGACLLLPLVACSAPAPLPSLSLQDPGSPAPEPRPEYDAPVGDEPAEGEAADPSSSATQEPSVPTPPGTAGPGETPQPFAPATPGVDESDWVQLVSGEWLRGEIKDLRKDVLEFDSDELDDLEIDWEDVQRLRPGKSCVVLLQSGEIVTDQVLVDGSVLQLGTEETGGVRTLDRNDLVSLVHSHKRERNYWSGSVDVGATARKGNNDQVDAYFKADAKRRTARSRIDMALTMNQSSVSGVETASNQRFTTNWNIYASREFYWTPLNLELYRDVFQNIAFRATPGAGAGYLVIDSKRTEWSVDGGVGVRYTRFLSVPPGEDQSDLVPAGLLGTKYEIELTKSTDLNFAYNAQISLEDFEDTNQTTVAEIEVDITGDLDLGVTVQWDRVGKPTAGSDGVVPKKDDFRLIVTLGWDF